MSYKENTEKQAFIKRVTIVVPGGENNFWMRYSIGAEHNGKKIASIEETPVGYTFHDNKGMLIFKIQYCPVKVDYDYKEVIL